VKIVEEADKAHAAGAPKSAAAFRDKVARRCVRCAPTSTLGICPADLAGTDHADLLFKL
jgi:hypothetical protein